MGLFNLNELLIRFQVLSKVKILFDTGLLALSSILSRGSLFARDIILAAAIGPSVYGNWTQILVVMNYALHMPLGFQHVLSRDVPFALGQNDIKKVHSIESISFLITILGPFVITIAYLFVYYILGIKHFYLTHSIILLLLATLFLQQWYAYFSVLLRAHQFFKIFSIGFALLPFINLAAILLAYKRVDLEIAIISLFFSYLTVNIYWFFYSPWKILDNLKSISFSRNEFYSLAKIAFPLFISGLFGILLTSVDRLVISFYYDVYYVGIYGFAFIITQSLSLIISPINQAIYPRIMKVYGATKSSFDLKSYFVFLTLLLSLLVLLIISFLYFYSNHLVVYFLPSYIDSLGIFKILILSNIFIVIYGGANTLSIAINDQISVLKIQLYVTLFQLILILLFSYFKLDLILVALVMLFGAVINSFFSLYISEKKMFMNKWEYISFNKFLFLQLVISITCLVLIDMGCNFLYVGSILASIIGHIVWLIVFGIQLTYVYKYIYRLGFLSNLVTLYK
jgi:O-antigen/teichoic acid export membrane protein